MEDSIVQKEVFLISSFIHLDSGCKAGRAVEVSWRYDSEGSGGDGGLYSEV